MDRFAYINTHFSCATFSVQAQKKNYRSSRRQHLTWGPWRRLKLYKRYRTKKDHISKFNPVKGESYSEKNRTFSNSQLLVWRNVQPIKTRLKAQSSLTNKLQFLFTSQMAWIDRNPWFWSELLAAAADGCFVSLNPHNRHILNFLNHSSNGGAGTLQRCVDVQYTVGPVQHFRLKTEIKTWKM